ALVGRYDHHTEFLCWLLVGTRWFMFGHMGLIQEHHEEIFTRQGEPAPYVIGVHGPPEHYTKHSLNEVQGPLQLYRVNKGRYDFWGAPMMWMIDAPKEADVASLLIDGKQGSRNAAKEELGNRPKRKGGQA
ncbi:hypothetical protein MKW92_032281, partial [Papaver armeniacum]